METKLATVKLSDDAKPTPTKDMILLTADDTHGSVHVPLSSNVTAVLRAPKIIERAERKVANMLANAWGVQVGILTFDANGNLRTAKR